MGQEVIEGIVRKLMVLNRTQGYVLFNDVSSLSDEYGLSLSDFDVLTNMLASNGIQIYEDVPNEGSNRNMRNRERRMPREREREVEYSIEKHLAILSTSNSGWTKELNLISWNNRPAKFDIRDWAPEHVKMGKGVTLSDEEADSLISAILNYRKGIDIK